MRCSRQMSFRVLTAADIERLLPMSECIEVVAGAFVALEQAGTLAIVGTGVQARTHLESIPLVRPIERVRVAGRTPERAGAFVEELWAGVPFELEACESAEEAVRGADVVVTATTSREP